MTTIVAYRDEHLVNGPIQTMTITHNGTVAQACQNLDIPDSWYTGATEDEAIANYQSAQQEEE